MPIRAAIGFVIGSLDPHHAATAGALTVLSHIHDPLLRRDPATGALLPGVLRRGAARVGDRRYVLDLDDRARFQDGSPVAAEDVSASLGAMLHGRGSGGLLAAALDGIQETRVVADRQVELLTDASLPMIDERLALVRVLPKAVLDADSSRGDGLLLGTGPYRVSGAGRDGALLEPSPSYRLGGPADPRTQIELLAAPDADERVDRLLSGDVQAIEEPSPAGLQRITERPDLASQWVRGMNMSWLLFNCSDPALSEPRTRRALAMAINRDELAHATTHSEGPFSPSSAYLPRWHRDHVACHEEPTYNPEGARTLLRTCKAEGLEIDLLVSSAAWVEGQAEMVVNHLAAVGVVAVPRTAHTADLFADDIPAGRFQVLLASGDPSVYADDAEFVLRWYLTGRWARRYCHLPEEEVLENEALVGRLARTTEAAWRRDLLGLLQTRAARQGAMTVLGHRSQPTAWTRRLQGFRPSPTPGLDLRNTYLAGGTW